MFTKPMIKDPKKNLNAVAGKGAEAPLLLQSSCYNTGWCYECSQWQGRHCPAAISGIGQPLATSQSPGWVSSIHITVPWVSISPSITVEHLLTIDTAGTPHPSLEHQPPSPS